MSTTRHPSFSRVRDYPLSSAVSDIAFVYKKTHKEVHEAFVKEYVFTGKTSKMEAAFKVNHQEFMEKAKLFGHQQEEGGDPRVSRSSAVIHYALSLFGGAKEHRQDVQDTIREVVTELLKRGRVHDLSKLGEEERPHFAKVNGRLKKAVYGTPEYYEALEELRPALEHHYANNRHHPEHHKPLSTHAISEYYRVSQALQTMSEEEVIPPYTGVADLEWAAEALRSLGDDTSSRVSNMNLFDLIEMFCDWRAVSKASGGDLKTSITHSAERYNISPQLTRILLNTVECFEESK